ncbi:MAG: hypothetical protein Q9200_005054 [Gallowayella weberi]
MHVQSIPMWTGSGNNYAYLVTDESSKDAVVIDPANPPEYVRTFSCEDRNAFLTAMLLL